jgi:PAS domain S-box-containing protein
MPFLRTDQRCLVCHGEREKAPEGLRARYAGAGGYGDTPGNLRAIESLRVPIEREKFTALIGTLAVLAGFGAIGFLFVFNRTLNQTVQEKTSALASREMTFRRLLEAADAVPFEYSPEEDRYTYVGPQFREIFGGDPAALKTRKDMDSVVHPDDRDMALRLCREATQRGEDHDCEMRIIRHDGKVAIIHQTVNIVKEAGKPVQVVGFIHDVTALRRNEAIQKARLLIAENAMALPLDELIQKFVDEVEKLTESQIGFFHFVETDQQTIHTKQWSTRTLATGLLQGKGERFSLEHAALWAECIKHRNVIIHNDFNSIKDKNGFPAGRAPLTRELVFPITHSGKIVALLGVGNKQAPYDSLDVGLIGQLADIVIEIILRKRTEEESQKIQAHLIQAQKVESIGRLAGGVAHDFNNMLSVILGNAEMALQEVKPGSSVHEGLVEIQTAAQRSAAITRQLLAFARKQIASPKVLDLNDTVEGMLRMLRRLIGEDIDLVWHPRPSSWKVKIDPSQVDQILANLATNARDAIQGVGKVTVETQQAVLDEDYCRSHAGIVPGAYVVLIVSDNGCGIPEEQMVNIFEPFFTTKGPGEGTGLGLATVFGIVKQNGGSINVYSELGKGTTFKIYLPRYEGEGSVMKTEAVAKADVSGRETILLVEDETAILKLANKILSGLGYTVLAANNCQDALRIAEGYAGTIHLLITDVILPDMNGRELAEKLVAIKPEIKCLYMSGYTADVIVHRGILADGLHFIQKPYTGSVLGDKVRALLND